jgi:dihydrofolate reductase
MGKLIYSMMASLDSLIEGPDGELDWHVIDEELHRHFNDLESTFEMHLYGRRLYEIMSAFWPTADQNLTAPAYVVEYARIWQAMPKIVFSKTLAKVEWNSRLVREVIPQEINQLKEQSRKNLSLGGPNLATTFRRLGLIDEYWVYVNPVVVGKGKPMFADMDDVARLQLVETRPFRSGVMLLRYEPADGLESNLQQS